MTAFETKLREARDLYWRQLLRPLFAETEHVGTKLIAYMGNTGLTHTVCIRSNEIKNSAPLPMCVLAEILYPLADKLVCTLGKRIRVSFTGCEIQDVRNVVMEVSNIPDKTPSPPVAYKGELAPLMKDATHVLPLEHVSRVCKCWCCTQVDE